MFVENNIDVEADMQQMIQSEIEMDRQPTNQPVSQGFSPILITIGIYSIKDNNLFVLRIELYILFKGSFFLLIKDPNSVKKDWYVTISYVCVTVSLPFKYHLYYNTSSAAVEGAQRLIVNFYYID